MKKKRKISFKPNKETLFLNAKDTAKFVNPMYEDIDWTIVVTDPRSCRKENEEEKD